MRVVLLLLLLSPMASAATVDLYIDISSDGTVREEFVYHFENPYNRTFIHQIEDIVVNVSVHPNSTFTVRNSSGSTHINITPTSNLKELRIIAWRRDKIFSNEQQFQFLTEIELNHQLVRNLSAWVKLPPGHAVTEDSYVPQTGTVTTDGRYIIVTWEDQFLDEIPVISVTYTPVLEEDTRTSYVLSMIVVVLLLVLAGYILHSRRSAHKTLLRGFRSDEKKAIEYIRKKGPLFQKELHKEFGFSRAKVTRIVKKLERKGLVEKEGHGRTNKLRWKG